MKVNFQDICGHSTTLDLPNNADVSYTSKLLSHQLEISENQILFVSPNEKQNYYPNDESMQNVIDENPEYVVYTKIIKKDQNSSPEKLPPQRKSIFYTSKYSSLKKVPINLIILLRNIKRWNLFSKNPLYIEYSERFQKIPDDFQQKIDEIAVLGFEIEDIKEALRNSEYNVLFAINSLVYRNSNENKPQNRNDSVYRFNYGTSYNFFRSNTNFIHNNNDNLAPKPNSLFNNRNNFNFTKSNNSLNNNTGSSNVNSNLDNSTKK